MTAPSWLAGRSALMTARVSTAALWGLVALGALGGIYASLRPAPVAAKVTIPGPTTGAEGVAQLYVAAWLRGSADAGAYYPVTPPAPFAPTVTIPAPRVTRTAALEADEITPGYWSVVVGAEVVTEVTATRFFRVAVVRASGAYVVASLPAEVAAPLGARAPVLDVGDAVAPAPTDAVGVAVTRFLGALLTGDGELSRYVSPGAAIRPVRPAPYVSVSVVDLASRSVPGPTKTLEVIVTAAATDSAGRVTTLSYPLTLAQRSGRWEVAAELAGPTLSSEQPHLATTSTAVLPTTTVVSVLPNTTSTTVPPSTSTTGLRATTTTGR